MFQSSAFGWGHLLCLLYLHVLFLFIYLYALSNISYRPRYNTISVGLCPVHVCGDPLLYIIMGKM